MLASARRRMQCEDDVHIAIVEDCMTRLAPLTEENMTDEQREIAEAIASGPRGGLRGPFQAWLRSPVMADRAQRLGEFCRYHSSLQPHLSELAIILAGRQWRSQYEFWAHARMAREAGLPEEIIEAVRTGTEPPFRDDQERVIYDVVTEYYATNGVADDTYQRAISILGERGLVDLIGIVGYYGIVSMTLNIFQVDLPEGVEPPFPQD